MQRTLYSKGFTLVELSIVLVIVGLIVGVVLVGQDLIRAAAMRAQISQVEKYNAAVNTFRDKFGALPGDIPPSLVQQFGFTVMPIRPGTQGQGDGNGILEGYYTGSGGGVRDDITAGETAWFWEDLSANSHLIDGTFNTAGVADTNSGPTDPLVLFPAAKIGNGNYIYIYSRNDINYFAISVPQAIDGNGAIYGIPGLTVAQAYAMDLKIDDGYPQSGSVIAKYENWTLGTIGSHTIWAMGGGTEGTNTGAPDYAASNAATSGSAFTCYDNGGLGGAQQYSIQISGGSNINCALSFRFQ